MAKYSKKANKTVASALRRKKKGTLTSGRSGRKVKSRAQAIAIGISEAREKGQKVPPGKKSSKEKSRQKEIRYEEISATKIGVEKSSYQKKKQRQKK